ncbi:acyl-CoA dehydrogenase [Nocardia sp. CS682]|uniref:acyl-CoA dehydrogenase family protein n=1 Tax=Nocardia sp. CS682 TaxID=1047172 RepID=UPI00142FEB88|nr:acyl-CoA dehydrogenase [Nocardia sp. CS682]
MTIDHDVTPGDTLRSELQAFLDGPGSGTAQRKLRDRLRSALPDAYFAWPDGTTRQERLTLVYARARDAGRAAPPATALLDDPNTLCALLSRAAVADPDMFHILLVHYTLVLAPILRSIPAGPSAGLAAVRARLETMDSFGSALMTESSRSNSHLHPRTQAVFDPETGDFVLHTPDADASKFPNSTGHPGVPKTGAVYAQLMVDGTQQGVFVFIVELRGADGATLPGVQITPAPDSFALPCDFASVRFDRMRIPLHAWLSDGATIDAEGRFKDTTGDAAGRLARTMSIGAPHVWRGVIAACAGVTQASARILQSHTANRVTMGRLAPEQGLIRYRNQQEAVLGALAAAYVLTVLSRHTILQSTTASAPALGDATWAPWSTVDSELPLLKACATRIALDAIASCRTHCGAAGFVTGNRLNAFHGFVNSYFCAGGDNELILMDTAHSMTDTDRYQPPGRHPRSIEAANLSAPESWVSLARNAERHFHRCLTARLAQSRSAGSDQFTAWNDNLALAQAAATARADRIVLELLRTAYDGAPSPVRRLLRLYALTWIQQNAGLLVEQRLVPSPLLDHVWQHRRALCDELVPDIADLAAAFDLPNSDAIFPHRRNNPTEPTSGSLR